MGHDNVYIGGFQLVNVAAAMCVHTSGVLYVLGKFLCIQALIMPNSLSMFSRTQTEWLLRVTGLRAITSTD